MELNRLHDLGLKGKLPPADIVGGTFSLSNIGAVSQVTETIKVTCLYLVAITGAYVCVAIEYECVSVVTQCYHILG